jgi:ABC-2 type transport system ATP-binding protein
LIADQRLDEFAARSARLSVRVESPDLADLTPVLLAEGDAVAVRRETETLAYVSGLPAARIGELAHEHRVLLHEMATQTTSLETAFMELTADSVEYTAGEAASR